MCCLLALVRARVDSPSDLSGRLLIKYRMINTKVGCQVPPTRAHPPIEVRGMPPLLASVIKFNKPCAPPSRNGCQFAVAVPECPVITSGENGPTS